MHDTWDWYAARGIWGLFTQEANMYALLLVFLFVGGAIALRLAACATATEKRGRWPVYTRYGFVLVFLVVNLACDTRPANKLAPPLNAPPSEWPAYGGDAGGQRYSVLDDITRDHVSRLTVAWTYHTGDMSDGKGTIPSTSAFEVTPILVEETLYFCTPFNRVIAFDPETGKERWTYDPHIDLSARYANQLVCRGVSTWLDPDREVDSVCRRRIFTATNDARLIALDAVTGKPCADFGAGGIVDLNPGVGDILW
jgi:glucose dehydrogenase